MRAAVAAAGVGVGLCLVGVALGLVYLDVREFRAAVHEAELHGGDSDDAAFAPLVDDTSRVLVALVSGSLGAGLMGAGAVVGVLEVVRQASSGGHAGEDVPAGGGRQSVD